MRIYFSEKKNSKFVLEYGITQLVKNVNFTDTLMLVNHIKYHATHKTNSSNLPH